MAEASIQFLLQTLSSLIKGEIGLILGVNAEINKLSSNLTAIQAVLQDAEDKQFEDEAIRDWLRKLNLVSFEIEDVLDECVTELGRLEYQSRISKCIEKILCKWKIARRIKKVAGKLDIVAAERAKFHLSETTIALQSKLPAIRETGSLLNEAELVIGREEERDKIIDILLNKFRDLHQLSVLPIIGLGGLGKTTLARLVFNDNRVTEHFGVKLWVCVSDNFDQKTLLKAIITSATPKENASSLQHLDALHLDALERRIFELLHQKRYLLVLDDVWNDDQEKWLVLKNQLACGKTGSSIIVTTRLRKVADIMATTTAHDLEGLSEQNCWLLFKERAFGQAEGEHTELEDIGRQIVEKCAGVPLAAITLGGLLRFKRREEEWIRVKESPLWNLPQQESSILPALRLSYNHLPVTHRQCFAYCAVFPKDSRITKEELIRQWMAHGKISSDGDVEETGDKIFDELVLRSLLINVTTDDDGIISFQMHDLVHDLAQSIMENKVPAPQAELDSKPMSSRVRHVDLSRNYVVFPSRSFPGMDLLTISLQFNRLRSLDASWSRIRDVPPAIGKLIQLRYLNLSNNWQLQTLPEELCSLWNLKILDLSCCSELERLPKRMRRLCNLRRLFLEGCKSLNQMPPKFGDLTSLNVMTMFVVGEERNNQIGELQSLNLGGKLEITHLERVHERHLDANKPILAEKRNLRRLKLKWGTSSQGRGSLDERVLKALEPLDERVLKALEPPGNVETLEIVGFQGKNIPLWTGSSVLEIKLIELRIEDCYNCVCLPQVVAELPHLKKLELRSLRALECIVEDEGCDLGRVKFPVLEELTLWYIHRVKGLLKKETGEFFPNLRKLEISGCSSLLSLPQLSSLRKLEIYGCSSLCSLPHLSSLVDLDCTNTNVTSVGGNLDNLSTLIIHCGMMADVCVPKECLTNLKSLEIWHADKDLLPEEGLQGLKSVKELSMYFAGMRCLPARWLSHLTSLEALRLRLCRQMVEIAEEVKYLHNLKELELWGLPKMVCLPDALQHLHALQFLTLRDLELEALPDWLGNFTSLCYLSIIECPQVVSIPSSIKQLARLKTLNIENCPKLEKQCEKGKGDDWHKIAHIPNIFIYNY